MGVWSFLPSLLGDLRSCHSNHCFCVRCEVHAETEALVEYCAWLPWLPVVFCVSYVLRKKKHVTTECGCHYYLVLASSLSFRSCLCIVKIRTGGNGDNYAGHTELHKLMSGQFYNIIAESYVKRDVALRFYMQASSNFYVRS